MLFEPILFFFCTLGEPKEATETAVEAIAGDENVVLIVCLLKVKPNNR